MRKLLLLFLLLLLIKGAEAQSINCSLNNGTQTSTNDTTLIRVDIYVKHESEAWPAQPTKTCLNTQTCTTPIIDGHVGIYQLKMVWTHDIAPYEGEPLTCATIPNPKEIINLNAYTIQCDLTSDSFCPIECNATNDVDCIPEWEEIICNTTSPTGKTVSWGRYECGMLDNINVTLTRTEACIGLWTTDVILYASDEVGLHREIDKKTIQIDGNNTASVILTYDVDEHNVTSRDIEFSAGEPANESNATLIFCNGVVTGDCERCMDIDTGVCYVPEVVISDFVDSGGDGCDNTGNASQNYCTDAGGWTNNTDLYQDVCCCLSSGYWDGRCCDSNDYWLSSDGKWICSNGGMKGYFAGNACKTALDNANLCEYDSSLGLFWNNNNWSATPPSSCFCKTNEDCNVAAGEICLNNVCLVPSSAEISFLQKTTEVFDSQTAAILLKITNNMIIDDKVHLELNSGNELDYWSWFFGQKENANRTQMDVEINAESSKIVAIEVFGGKLGNYNLTATGFSYVTSGISGLKPIRDTAVVRIIPSPEGIYAKDVPDLSYVSILITALLAMILYKKFY